MRWGVVRYFTAFLSLWRVAAHTMVALRGLGIPPRVDIEHLGLGLFRFSHFNFPISERWPTLSFSLPVSLSISTRLYTNQLFHLESWDDDMYYPS